MVNITVKKDKKTAQQKMNILIECFKNTDFKPSRSKTDKHNETHGFNLGMFWNNLMSGQNKQLFEKSFEEQKEWIKYIGFNISKGLLFEKYLIKKEKRYGSKLMKIPVISIIVLIQNLQN